MKSEYFSPRISFKNLLCMNTLLFSLSTACAPAARAIPTVIPRPSPTARPTPPSVLPTFTPPADTTLYSFAPAGSIVVLAPHKGRVIISGHKEVLKNDSDKDCYIITPERALVSMAWVFNSFDQLPKYIQSCKF